MTKGSQSQRVCVQCVAVRSPDIRRATVRVKVNTFSPQATPVRFTVAGLRVRSDARPTTASMRIELPPLESGVEYERTSREARRSPSSRPALRAATRPGPRINPYSFWRILASRRVSPEPDPRSSRRPGGKLSVDRILSIGILPAARDVLRSGAQRFATGTRPPCYCFVHATATVL